MKRVWPLVFLFVFSLTNMKGQIVINELETIGLERIELKNVSNLTVDVNNFILCSYPTYNLVSNLVIISGNYLMAPGDIVVVNGHPLGDTDGELALYLNYNFTSPNAIIDYVEWGSSFHVRSTIAQQAGIWTAGDFVPSPPAGVSLEYDGTGDASTDWFVQQNPTFGMENGIVSVENDLLQESVEVLYSANANQLFISSSNPAYLLSSVNLLDVQGREVRTEHLKEAIEVNLSTASLAPGIYLVRLCSGSNYITKKIIIS